MSDPLHPTNKRWEMFDPEIDPPPTNGEHLLCITEGGTLHTGPWRDTFLAWAYKPVIPQSVKDRMDAKYKR